MKRADFLNWVISEAAALNVVVDLSGYERMMKELVAKASAASKSQAEELESFQFQPDLVRQLSQFGYPDVEQLINILTNPGDMNEPESEDAFDDAVSNFTRWYIENMKQGKIPWEARKIYTHIIDHDSIVKGHAGHDEQSYGEWYNQLVSETAGHMERLKQRIQQAIASIPTWSGSQVTISAEAHYSEYNTIATEPADDATITVGSRGTFSLFQHDGKIEIDDILEGGYEDEEFFDTPQVKGDYYALINELRNPGSSQKGRVLTLYTARPQRDRAQYMNAKQLPINLFLTNSYSHAEGLAHDLGASEVRDVYVVRMDSKYLTQTLDGPVKYYMVSVDNAPVVSMNLY